MEGRYGGKGEMAGILNFGAGYFFLLLFYICLPFFLSQTLGAEVKSFHKAVEAAKNVNNFTFIITVAVTTTTINMIIIVITTGIIIITSIINSFTTINTITLTTGLLQYYIPLLLQL